MRTRAFLAWCLLLLTAVACHKLAGDDYTIEGGSTSCIPGLHQCVGNVLQRCNDPGDAWENAGVCASEALCSDTAGACLTALCQPSQRRCQGAELEECAPTRDGWVSVDTCVTAAHCNATVGTCTTAPCMPGMVQCSGPELQVCRDDQTGWDVLDTCQTSALCVADPGACDVPLCTTGAMQCDGAVLQSCSDGLDAWTTVAECDSDALCDAEAGACGEAGCSTPGVHRCSGAGLLERCADDLTGWTEVETCLSAGHCDAVNGRCNAAPCTTGSYQCNGAILETCNADSTGWDMVETCETDGLCTSTIVAALTACADPACDEGEFQCVDTLPQICNAGRTGFRENGGACMTAELCDEVTGTCTDPACDEGETTCTDTQPEICNPGRTAFVPNGDPCDTADLCNPDTGICGDAACNVNQTRCAGTGNLELQVCNAAQDGWDMVETCLTAELCMASLDSSACDLPTCDVTDRRCTGAQPEICNPGRTGFIPDGAACPNEELCNDVSGLCDSATCTAGQTQCSGAALQICNATLNGWDACATCANVDICMASDDDDVDGSCSAADCVTCFPDETRCDPAFLPGTGSLQVCNSTLSGWDTCPNGPCATPELCAASDDNTLAGASCNAAVDCVAPACDVAERTCNGDMPQECNAGRTAFVDDPPACDPGLCDDATGTCLVCEPDCRTCNGAGDVDVCDSDGMGSSVVDCPLDDCTAGATCMDDCLTP